MREHWTEQAKLLRYIYLLLDNARFSKNFLQYYCAHSWYILDNLLILWLLYNSCIHHKTFSQTSHYIISFNFLSSAVKKFYFGVPLLGGPPNLVRLVRSIVSQTTVSFNFLCSAAQELHFRGAILGISSPGGPPNLVWIIVSQTTSSWVSTFYIKPFKRALF